MTKRLMTALILTAMLLPIVGGAAPTLAATGDPVLINEFSASTTGTDVEYVELFGTPNTDFSAYTILEIEGDGSVAGVVDEVINVGTTDADGFWLGNLPANALENGTITLLLVENFTGALSDDLDTDNDGTFDVTPWDAVVDAVAVNDGGAGDITYGVPSLGPNYDGLSSFAPGGASRYPDGFDTDAATDWVRNDFDLAGIPGFPGTPDLGEAFNTPGAANELVPPPPPPPVVTIMEIQGTGQFSPYDGQVVETSGIVTLFTANNANFWLQDPAGDDDPSTSDGIFVAGGGFPASGPRPNVGDAIRIIAQVDEQQFGTALPLTRLRSVGLIEVLSSGNSLPAPVQLNDLPDESIVDGIAFWEPLEGMRVSVDNAPVSSATNGFGEFGMLAKDDAKPGSGFFADTQHILVRNLGGEEVDYNPERIMVDDSSLGEAINVQPGDRVRNLVGVVDYTFSMYKLQPGTFDIEFHNLPNLPASKRSGGFGNASITTFNVENLFDDFADPSDGKDDEGSTLTTEELQTKLSKLALAIQVELELPEIMVLQEVENQAIAQELANRVNGAAGTNYMAVSFETSDVRGIEVAFIWDTDRVTLLDAFQLTDDIVPGVSGAFGPSSPSPGREPIVGVFDIDGYEVTIVGNHFKSKGGDDPLYGVNWPPNRITETQRKAQAQVVRDYVNILLAADPNALVMVAGDLNDFQFSEPGEGPDNPVAILEGAPSEVPLTDLLNLEKPAETWTFIFDGNAQVLDHMLVSPALLDYFQAADVLHFNTTAPTPFLEDNASSPQSASDHDPLEGRFQFK